MAREPYVALLMAVYGSQEKFFYGVFFLEKKIFVFLNDVFNIFFNKFFQAWLSRSYFLKYVVLMALSAKKVADPCPRRRKSFEK